MGYKEGSKPVRLYLQELDRRINVKSPDDEMLRCLDFSHVLSSIQIYTCSYRKRYTVLIKHPKEYDLVRAFL